MKREKPLIYIPMIEVGAGHKVPSIAIKQALENLYPDKYDIKIVDFLQVANLKKTDEKIKKWWRRQLKHAPLAKGFYKMMQSLSFLRNYGLFIISPSAYFKAIRFMKKINPDIVCSTHFFTHTIAQKARDKYHLHYKVIVFVTDPFDAYEPWCNNKVDLMLVASNQAKQKALELGMRDDQVKIVPYPIRKEFSNLPKNLDSIKKNYSLLPNIPTVLVCSGGEGLGKINKQIKFLYTKGLKANLLFVTGKNEKRYEMFSKLKEVENSPTNLILFRYVDNMQELLAISDICMIKGGANNTMEALYTKTPPLFSYFVNQQEKTQVDFCVENHFGWYLDDPELIFSLLSNLSKQDVTEKIKNIEKAHFENGAPIIAKIIHGYLEK